MSMTYPSNEFDDAVSAICHGVASDEQFLAVQNLLLKNEVACEEYIWRLEIHSALTSNPDIYSHNSFESAEKSRARLPQEMTRIVSRSEVGFPMFSWSWNVAVVCGVACVVASMLWWFRPHTEEELEVTSKAIAMLNHSIDTHWETGNETIQAGAPLEPGLFRLRSGMAQIVFYSGERMAVEGPSTFQLVSSSKVTLIDGHFLIETSPTSSGFKVDTPHAKLIDDGSVCGVSVRGDQSEFHVLDGKLQLETHDQQQQCLSQGSCMIVDSSGAIHPLEAELIRYAGLMDVQSQSAKETKEKVDRWRTSSQILAKDKSLLLHFDFNLENESDWRLPNLSRWHHDAVPEATIIGCQWTHGRWKTKRALAFESVNDRVRMYVPNELSSMTLAAWIRIQGLDRKFNSLFMCDEFLPGSVHWLIRNDGALGLTIIDSKRKQNGIQIAASPSVLTVDQFGMFIHLAVVLDGENRQVTHFVNSKIVSKHSLKIDPPFRMGTAELGNWESKDVSGHDSTFIRNFSGAMDEFCLFDRALNEGEILQLYRIGSPQPF